MDLDMPTFPCLGGRLPRAAGFFKGPPFEVLPIAFAHNVSLETLLASGLYLVAFESLLFAGNTACRI